MPAAHARAFALETPASTAPSEALLRADSMGMPFASWLRVPPSGASG